MHFFLAVNSGKDPELTCSGALAEYIRRSGASAEILTASRDDLGNYHFAFPSRRDAVVLVLGGDGTMLQCAGDLNAAGLSYPMLGINLGTLGFLTQVEQEGAEAAVDAVLRGDYTLEEYPLLSAQLDDRFCQQALNDVVVGRQGFTRMLTLSVFVSGHYAYRTRCDGILVSTALGSTAYNLSMGGPVVPPETPVFVVTPMGSHLPGLRPMVVPDTSEVAIRLEGGAQTREGLVTCDGRSNGIRLEAGDTVTVRKHASGGRLLRLRDGQSDFFGVLREKLLSVR